MIFLPPLLLACVALGPGLLLLRRFRLAPLERLVLAIGVSLFMVYCAAFAIFILDVDNKWYWLISAAGVILTLIAWRDIKKLFHHRIVRVVCVHYLLLVAWFLLISLVIRNLSGGMWCVDWVEHYERSIFFLDHLPHDYRFLGLYLLPARPPTMNVLSAQFMAQAGAGYPVHQVAFICLNTLVILPCHLFARRFGGRAYRPRLVSAMLALVPMVAQNATFGWTKQLTVFYVLSGLWLYLRGWERRSGVRIVGAFAVLSIAMLVHYSAGPYAAVIGGHFLFVVLKKLRNPVTVIAQSAVVCAAILATWFGWSLMVYHGSALTSNATVVDSAGYSLAGNVEKICGNLYRTIVPHPISVSRAEFERVFNQPTTYGRVRDYAFTLYQDDLIPSAGSIGGILVLYLLWRRLPRDPHRGFWIYFILATTCIGAAVQGNQESMGLAQITLQTLTWLALALLASAPIRQPTWFKILLVIGFAVDAVFGVLLQFYCSSKIFHMVRPDAYQIVVDRDTMSAAALMNYAGKMRTGWSFIGDFISAGARRGVFAVMILISVTLLGIIIRELSRKRD